MNGEAAHRWRGNDTGEARCRIRDDALDARGEPDNAGMADALLGRHAEQGQGQAIEGMGGINDLDRLMRENSEAEWGSLW